MGVDWRAIVGKILTQKHVAVAVETVKDIVTVILRILTIVFSDMYGRYLNPALATFFSFFRGVDLPKYLFDLFFKESITTYPARLSTHISELVNSTVEVTSSASGYLSNKERLQDAYFNIFESEILQYTSCTLIICSVVLLLIAVQDVHIASSSTLEEHHPSTVPPLSPGGRDGRRVPETPLRGAPSRDPTAKNIGSESVRSFAASKARVLASGSASQSTGLNLNERKAQAERFLADKALTIPSTPQSEGGYDSGVDDQSFMSDDNSRASEYMYSPLDPRRALEEVRRKSTKDPSVLVGWQISVNGQVGLVIAIKKSLGRATQFEVKFEKGASSLIALKRSDKKGLVPFTLLQKMT